MICTGNLKVNFREKSAHYTRVNTVKLKLRVFLAGHIVSMVTYCATQLTTRFLMIGQFVDTMMLASTSLEWL